MEERNWMGSFVLHEKNRILDAFSSRNPAGVGTSMGAGLIFSFQVDVLRSIVSFG